MALRAATSGDVRRHLLVCGRPLRCAGSRSTFDVEVSMMAAGRSCVSAFLAPSVRAMRLVGCSPVDSQHHGPFDVLTWLVKSSTQIGAELERRAVRNSLSS